MPTNPTDPRREHPSTYFVQDRSNEEELIRLQIQDQMLTSGMGGVLPEQPDPTIFGRVLDVGCGTGDWLIAMAKAYPTISVLIGVDVSKRLVDHAQAKAEAQQVNDRVEFHVMNALQRLEFPSGYFDLVNERFGQSWLRTWDWPRTLQEFQRICRPGGVIRVTEANFIGENTSSALTRLYEITFDAFYRSGHYFTPSGDGVISQLPRLLRQYGIQNVQTHTHRLEHRASNAEWQSFYEDMRHIYRTMLPYLRKWTRVPDDYETIYQQALSEMLQTDFVATWELLTTWGTQRQLEEESVAEKSIS